MNISKTQELEVNEILDSMGVSQLELGTTIGSMAALVKIVGRVVEICGVEFQKAIEQLVIIENLLVEVLNQTEEGLVLAKYLAHNVPSSVAPSGTHLLPHRKKGILKTLPMIEKSHSQLSLVKVLLESAVFAYEPMVNKVRPKMGGMANKTKNKWEKFEEQAHHADLVAAFVKRLLKVHRHQVGLNGAKILCVLGFPTNNNPWKQEKKSQNEFYKRATDGGTYLAFLDT